MRLSKSLLRIAALIGVVVTAACDSQVDSVTAPAGLPAGPNALIVPTGYSDVSAGANFACAVRDVDGGLVCWGDNDYGKATPPPGSYRQVSTGLNHACALRTDYVAVCWGQRDWGATAPPAITFSQVSAGYKYSCGVRMDNRRLACWGTNATALANVPSTVSFTQVSTGAVAGCGVTFGDKKVLCWGSNQYQQTNVVAGLAYTQVDVGSTYVCGIGTNGERPCWGANFQGQITPQPGTYTQVAAASTHTCAIRASDLSVVCWGQDRVGMLNAPAGAYAKVSAGDNSTCAIRTGDKAILCWGSSGYGMSTPPGISTAHTPPSALFSATASVAALDSFFLNLYSARVNGFPEATKFTYQFDCGDGKGYGAAQTANFIKCGTRVAVNRTVRGKVIDQDGDEASYALTVVVRLRTQTVSFTSTAPVSPVVGTTYTATATASSGLPVTIGTTSLYYCARSGNVITATGIGACTVTAEQKGDSVWAPATRVTQTIRAIWPFTGFFTTVKNQPQWNTMVAGRYAKLIFSLGGNRATSAPIVPSGTASTKVVTCDPNVLGAPVTLTAPVATAGVVYDSGTARYTLTWKTDAAWAGTCREVTVTLNDGTQRKLNFKFT